MSDRRIDGWKEEYHNLSNQADIPIVVSEQMAIVLIVQLQVSVMNVKPFDRDIFPFIKDFCDNLISQTSTSPSFKEVISWGWNRPIDFNNPVEPPDELA